MNFRYRLMQFMSGRYGVDKLFYVLFVVAALLAAVNIIVGSGILQLIVYLIMFYAIFRVLSRNHSARLAENRAVTGWLNTLSQKADTARQRRADTTHVYKKCPGCGAVLRLPRRKGKHTTVCPKCSRKFTVRVWKD